MEISGQASLSEGCEGSSVAISEADHVISLLLHVQILIRLSEKGDL